MNRTKSIAAIAALGVTFTGLAVLSPAAAEPVSNSYSIVGSDTLQDVVNALANGSTLTGSSVRTTVKNTTIGSFDATGTPSIQTKSGGPRFARPNGSGDGVKALSRSIDGQPFKNSGYSTDVRITGQIDIARSSSAGTVDANGTLLYVPFGRDAFAYAHNGTSAGFDSISGALMKSLFECTTRAIDGVTVTPVIPQDGSGTRKDFLKKIGVTEASMLEVTEAGGCVAVGQEHDTSALPVNAITPMSAAQWVAQNTGAGVSRIGTGVKLGSLVSGIPVVTGAGAATLPNKAYYDSSWGRDTFLVVERARVENPNAATYDAGLASIVNPEVRSSLTNNDLHPARAGAVKAKFGFLAPSTTVPYPVKAS